MAETMNGEVQLAAAREVVWAKLSDADALKPCGPGCESSTWTLPRTFRRSRREAIA